MSQDNSDTGMITANWFRLANDYGANEVLIKDLLDRILLHYGEPRRHYHNTGHLRYLLDLSNRFASKIRDRNTVAFSIFFHDIIYVPGSFRNEEKSAELAKEALEQLQVPGEQIKKITGYILATGDHLAVQTTDKDLKYFLDFDLSILAAEPGEYKQYAAAVAREYGVLPPGMYRSGRSAFLKNLLSLPYLFHTGEFRQNEERARKNMQEELLALQPNEDRSV